MTTEHLCPLLDGAHSTHLFFRMGEHLERARVPEVVVAAVRSGRMTALSKDGGSVPYRDRGCGETALDTTARTLRAGEFMFPKKCRTALMTATL